MYYVCKLHMRVYAYKLSCFDLEWTLFFLLATLELFDIILHFIKINQTYSNFVNKENIIDFLKTFPIIKLLLSWFVFFNMLLNSYHF